MTLAEKILLLRRQRGMSQEQLAEQLGVSRQAVSKWESEAAIPEIDKILMLSELFQVTTDYLLRNQEEEEKPETRQDAEEDRAAGRCPPEEEIRIISRQTATEYMDVKKRESVKIAIGTVMCILAAVPLILLGGFGESHMLPLYGNWTEDSYYILATALLLIIIAIAVGIFILSGIRMEKFSYIEKEPFRLAIGVKEEIRKLMDEYQKSYAAHMVVGVILCILCSVPLILVSMTDNDLLMIEALALLLCIVAVAVYLFIIAGMREESMKQLLQEGEYSPREKRKSKEEEGLSVVYWSIITAAYLGYSFYTNDWGRSWIIWPVAGVLYVAVSGIFAAFKKEEGI